MVVLAIFLYLCQKRSRYLQNSLSGLLGYSEGSNTSLTGVITDAGQLAVTLIVEIDGQKVTLNTREYEIDWITDQGRVIMWPNFVSENGINIICTQSSLLMPRSNSCLYLNGVVSS